MPVLGLDKCLAGINGVIDRIIERTLKPGGHSADELTMEILALYQNNPLAFLFESIFELWEGFLWIVIIYIKI